jgi:hypothetical protein
MIAGRDEWGLDPSVQRMRRIFSRVEAAQKELLEQLNISTLDSRLRHVRYVAKGLFERTWSLAATRGLNVCEEEAAGIYTHCLARVLRVAGIEVPEGVLKTDERLRLLIKEALP